MCNEPNPRGSKTAIAEFSQLVIGLNAWSFVIKELKASIDYRPINNKIEKREETYSPPSLGVLLDLIVVNQCEL